MAQVNIKRISFGILDPGEEMVIHVWTSDYNTKRKRGRFFSVSADPEIPFGEECGPAVVWGDNLVEMEIVRNWNTVWVDENFNYTFQSNVIVRNVGQSTTAYHLFEVETNN